MKRLWNCLAAALVLLGLMPVNARAAEALIPVGAVVGLQLSDGTVTVAAFDDAAGTQARDAGLKIGDEILKIDETAIGCSEDVRRALQDCDGDAELTLRRGSRRCTVTVPVRRVGDTPRLGIYLRQGIAGVGTVTFYAPQTGKFGTLGHGVSDTGGNLLNMKSGSAFAAEVLSVKKGKCGEPGQLKGASDDSGTCGTLLRNTPQGVFGVTSRGWEGKALPTAHWEELRTGEATIRSTVTGDTPREYSVEILKIYPKDRSDGRNLLLKVTDPALLETTGGIVQGMSGSPILQDGKLVGAVTHVLVNDPTMGYGIFIENMLDAAG